MDNNLKGLFYEKQIKDYIYKKFNKISYLWKETPELILINVYKKKVICNLNKHTGNIHIKNFSWWIIQLIPRFLQVLSLPPDLLNL